MERAKILTLGSCLQIDGADSIQYKINGILGRGAYGTTFMATVQAITSIGTILDTGYHVAVKEIDMPKIRGNFNLRVKENDQEDVFDSLKFMRLSELRHPNIVRFYDVSYRPACNTAFCVMEYINGKTLDDYIDENIKLSEDEAVRITKQIGQALSYLHSRGVLHLDLKPSNIMIKDSGDIVIIDFGLSKIDSYHDKNKTIATFSAGTPGYAPLEQTQCFNEEDFPVTMDVYALGATMYKMLTGIRPPEAFDILSDGFPLYVLQRHQVSDAVSKSIAIAMAPDKERRYDSVASFLQSLEEEKPDFDINVATEIRKQPQILAGHFFVPKNIERVTVEYYAGSMKRGYYGVVNKEMVRIATSREPNATCQYRKMSDERFSIFLSNLRSLNLPTRKDTTHRCDKESDESPLFSLELYDESNELVYKFWISGWNNEEGNIDGNIFEVEKNVRQIFPLLQEATQ